MRMVREHGGEASYLLFGAALEAGHHSPEFDFDEQVLMKALRVLYRMACVLQPAGEG